MKQKNNYNYNELIDCANGTLFGEGNARLPSPPMLMFDRITQIHSGEGKFKKGIIKAELDIKDNMWFFDCHFKSDPVMPGCLGLDAMWQLVGFFLGWNGHPGKGRALGVGEVKFTGQILPTATKVTYEIDMKRVIARSLVMGLGDGVVRVDGRAIYHATDLKVGLFTSTDGF